MFSANSSCATASSNHRFHYDSHAQLREHLADFVAAYNFAEDSKRLLALPLMNSSANPRKKTTTDLLLIQSIKCRD